MSERISFTNLDEKFVMDVTDLEKEVTERNLKDFNRIFLPKIEMIIQDALETLDEQSASVVISMGVMDVFINDGQSTSLYHMDDSNHGWYKQIEEIYEWADEMFGTYCNYEMEYTVERK